jgi:2-phosphoglycolate phosphatase
MPFAAVLFDFDGTLVDSYSAIAASVNHVRASHGLAALSVDEVKRFVGRGPEYLLTHTVPGGDLAADMARYRAHHPSVMLEGTRLLRDAAEVLAGLRHAGKRLGLCSNKPRFFSQQLLEHLGIAHFFDAVLGPEDVPRLKPAPDILQAAVARLGLPPHQVLYVGDMVVDIETARAAGLTVWTVPTGSEETAALAVARPDRLLGSLHDVLDHFAVETWQKRP